MQALTQQAAHLIEEGFASVASVEASWHPSGFAVFTLDEQHELGTLRLHIWPSGHRITRQDNAPIHTHVWHLCSLVLTGTYAETLYEVAPDAEAGTERYHSATIDYLRDRNALAESGTTSLRAALSSRHLSGDFHSVPADVPHETHIDGQAFVATLLITSPPASLHASMFSPRAISADSYVRPLLTSDEKSTLLRSLGHSTRQDRRM